MNTQQHLFYPKHTDTVSSAILLSFRVILGGVLFYYSFSKLMHVDFHQIPPASDFSIRMILEGKLLVLLSMICASLLILGLGTRIAMVFIIVKIILIIAMLAEHPTKESDAAFLYLFPSLSLLMSGGGRYSLDYFFFVYLPSTQLADILDDRGWK
ncbi:MAG: hypothetical protein MK212_21630, partial [Saprospiraceae bacterium]|nr:hypothetical protein [Saprospiraceae bacterium]